MKDDNVMIAAATTANVVNAIAIFFFMISYPYLCRAQLLLIIYSGNTLTVNINVV